MTLRYENKILGRRIVSTAADKGLTDTQVSMKLGLSRSTVRNQFESKEAGSMSRETYTYLLGRLGLNTYTLLASDYDLSFDKNGLPPLMTEYEYLWVLAQVVMNSVGEYDPYYDDIRNMPIEINMSVIVDSLYKLSDVEFAMLGRWYRDDLSVDAIVKFGEEHGESDLAIVYPRVKRDSVVPIINRALSKLHKEFKALGINQIVRRDKVAALEQKLALAEYRYDSMVALLQRDGLYDKYADFLRDGEVPAELMMVRNLALRPRTQNLLIRAGVNSVADVLEKVVIRDDGICPLLLIRDFGANARLDLYMALYSAGYKTWAEEVRKNFNAVEGIKKIESLSIE
jgi:transcriptional regulator with XRE-family HTH domain